MPWRERGIPQRISMLLLPAMVAIGFLGIATWVLFAISITPHGWSGMTAGARLVLIGFAGIPAYILFAIAGTVAILEDSIRAARLSNQDQMSLIAADIRDMRTAFGRLGSAIEEQPGHAAGPPGPAGEPGAAGERGLQGTAGAAGAAGAEGVAGMAGAAGKEGAEGEPGPRGAEGEPGPRGAEGRRATGGV